MEANNQPVINVSNLKAVTFFIFIFLEIRKQHNIDIHFLTIRIHQRMDDWHWDQQTASIRKLWSLFLHDGTDSCFKRWATFFFWRVGWFTLFWREQVQKSSSYYHFWQCGLGRSNFVGRSDTLLFQESIRRCFMSRRSVWLLPSWCVKWKLHCVMINGLPLLNCNQSSFVFLGLFPTNYWFISCILLVCRMNQ